METLYRTESYSGSGVRDIRDVIEYEMSELRNTDIPSYVLVHYTLSDGLRKDLEDILSLEPEGEYPFKGDRQDLRDTIDAVVKEIGGLKGTVIRFGLWLAPYESVRLRYCRSGDRDIDGYPTSHVILSDLDTDGALYGYAEMPRKIQ